MEGTAGLLDPPLDPNTLYDVGQSAHTYVHVTYGSLVPGMDCLGQRMDGLVDGAGLGWRWWTAGPVAYT